MIRVSRWSLSAVLIIVGLYVLLQPFPASPATCLAGWPGLSVWERLRACATFSELAPSFWSAVLIALVSIAVAMAYLRGRIR